MTIFTAAGTALIGENIPFNKNGSIVTLKKISETDWLLFGDLAEGDSEGFGRPFCATSFSWYGEMGVTFPVILGQPENKPVEQNGEIQNRWVDFEYGPDGSIGTLPKGIPQYISSLTLTHDSEVGIFSVNIKMSEDFVFGDDFFARVRLSFVGELDTPPSVSTIHLVRGQAATFLMPSAVNNGLAGAGDTVCLTIESVNL